MSMFLYMYSILCKNKDKDKNKDKNKNKIKNKIKNNYIFYIINMLYK